MEFSPFIDVTGWARDDFGHAVTVETCGFAKIVTSTFGIPVVVDKLITEIPASAFISFYIGSTLQQLITATVFNYCRACNDSFTTKYLVISSKKVRTGLQLVGLTDPFDNYTMKLVFTNRLKGGYMKQMDIKLYKLKVVKGKEKTAKEWLAFLEAHKVEGTETLKNELAYFEAYFTAVENGIMYIYMFFAAKDVSYSNTIAGNSKNELDIKHFEYMRSCIDLTAGDIMDCAFYLDNLEALNSY